MERPVKWGGGNLWYGGGAQIHVGRTGEDCYESAGKPAIWEFRSMMGE